MEKLTGCWLLMAALNFALAQDKVTPTYFKDGGELTMVVRPTSSERLYNILWKINGDLLAEWIKDQVTGEDLVPLTYYRTFIGRTALNLTTGRLVISKMTKADMGVYSVEVNNKVQNEKYNAVLIKEVPQPDIWIRPLTCSPDSDRCTLVCHGEVKDAGPVIYSWKKDGGEWKESGKDLDITKSGTSDVKTFTCRIQNPVSERESKPKDNPFLEKEVGGSGVGAGIIVTVLLAVAVAVGAAVTGTLWHFKKGPFKNKGDNGQSSTDKSRELDKLNAKPDGTDATDENGQPPATSGNNADDRLHKDPPNPDA
ncbi:hypothetical protein EPR50_G00182280 [Perca flavescens]|uniref:Ig-like domain-containing protein n=1 Tax=Perca flavescens TaxID=8167 RepID=A0A484CKH9_PERFV|nr:uncharacterized protein LOC114571942 [Perca flavescens]TDH01624.1 hypothetical protein EPR50_G00182280 [Perca flavescens]